jgi:hypothetical protein
VSSCTDSFLSYTNHRYYESTYKQKPDAVYAEKWLLLHGLISKDKALKIALKHFPVKKKAPAKKRKAPSKKKPAAKKKSTKKKPPAKKRKKAMVSSSSSSEEEEDEPPKLEKPKGRKPPRKRGQRVVSESDSD